MDDVWIKGRNVVLRNVKKDDLKLLWSLKYGEENPEWKKWDAPYYPHELIDFNTYIDKEEKHRIYDEKMGVYSELIMEKDHQIIGSIVYYWEHEPSRWLEIGITIFEANYWNGGYGTEAIKLFITYLFENIEIERVGLTTWSGNERMMAVALKVGMQLEGRMRKCRYFDGYYYDSIRMGILREEWESLQINN
ncbi:GNAT family N-acetyltransferase [Peribacillus butanolivorans]|uniref:GNAT family N-acetyltransferase n=1 Tax=Peribacillus butanolivorans TaxID=421767 RepID=A0AAX0S2X5_9BACI|nr:GNAT family protein [Peribacillus butanolivorans]PEJ32268.1 GNAT family N-acetyltransferase [Peribacillus butanolivorans]